MNHYDIWTNIYSTITKCSLKLNLLIQLLLKVRAYYASLCVVRIIMQKTIQVIKMTAGLKKNIRKRSTTHITSQSMFAFFKSSHIFGPASSGRDSVTKTRIRTAGHITACFSACNTTRERPCSKIVRLLNSTDTKWSAMAVFASCSRDTNTWPLSISLLLKIKQKIRPISNETNK